MVVHSDVIVKIFGNEREQSLGINGLAIGLIKVKILKALLKQGGENLVFFHEKRGLGHDDKFHLRSASV